MISGVLQFLYLTAALFFFLSSSTENRIIRRIAFTAGVGILLFHSFFLVQRSLASGHPPLTNMYETLHLLAFLVTFLFILSKGWKTSDLIGGFAALISAILMASCAIASPDIEPLLPALKSNWLLFHVTSCFISYASFALAMATALVYLLIDSPKAIFSLKMNKEEFLKKLDRATHRLIAFGYPLLTLGITTGSVWAELSWGRYWNWDPKETWAFATWIIYTAYLHLYYINGIKRKVLALIAVMAFGFVIFTYYGVNFWLATLHEYA